MTPILPLLDVLLVVMLIWLALSILRSKDLFRAVVLFTVFGVLIVAAWVRLRAPDIALAEAAIGTGLTSVLLLDAIGHLKKRTKQSGRNMGTAPDAESAKGWKSPAALFLFLVLIVVSGMAMIWVVTLLPRDGGGLSAAVEAAMGQTGVSSRVTAVLLDFRGYDTLLEIGVMIVAVAGVLSLRGRSPVPDYMGTVPDPVLPSFVRLVVPAAVVVGAYLLYEGAHAVGGAFQGGSVIAAALVLLRFSGIHPPSWLSGRVTEILVIAGFLVFLFVAAGVMAIGNDMLQYPQGSSGYLILLIEAGLAISTAFILAEILVSWRRS